MNLDRQWRRFGNMGLAFWSGAVPAFLIMNAWYGRAGQVDAEQLAQSHDPWYRDIPKSYADTHGWEFLLYALVALICFRLIAVWVFRWAERRTDNYLNRRWVDLYVLRRIERETRELRRDSVAIRRIIEK